jgi:hypothetical protein
MPDQQPLDLTDVLRAERAALAAAANADGSHAGGSGTEGPDPDAPLSALCISGGGIRSATFGLGAIQGLAEHGLLGKFDYLSTVSGGGYIGSWLTAWVNRAKGIDHVIPHIRRDAPQAEPDAPDPIQHLRDYNSYLTPRSGALSSDLWTVIATVIRNILLNWIVLIPLMMAALIVPRIYLSLLAFPELVYGNIIFATHPPDYGAPQLNAIGESPLVEYLLPFLSLAMFAAALFNTLRYLPGVGGRDHTTRDYALKILAPLIGAVLTFLLFDSLYYLGEDYVTHTNLLSVVIWTTAPCVAAWLAYLLFHRRPLTEKARLLFGPLSLAVAVMAAGIGVATWATTNYLLWSPDPHHAPSWAEYVTLGPPTILLGYCVGNVLFVGLSSAFLEDEDREWMSRSLAGVLVFCIVWAGVCAMVLVLPKWALDWQAWAHSVLAGATALTAWLSTFSGSATTNANPGAAGPGTRARLLSLAATAAPPLFLLLLAGVLSVSTNVLLQALHALTQQTLAGPFGEPVHWTDHDGMLTRAEPMLVVALAALLLAISWLMARWVNINTFSLHGMYRDRLVRAYLGASNPDRNASHFTGFCNSDDLPIASLDTRLRPFHVVNLTLNLVAGKRLAWQQRKAASFTATPLHCGSADVGYRPSSEYGGGMSLGTAVAISGAAASPNMGYHSSPVVGFIMTLFNARLGAWLGNPGTPGAETWKQSGPTSAIRSMVQEALGQTSDQSEYVYLSDGGHFENLGLYEMVRRRCRLIVVLDSGCDPDFGYEDLGNALRKIRIDQRIPIDFDDMPMQLLRERKRRWATATIRYSLVDGSVADGRLVYVKPMLMGNEPPDVLSYATANPAFPHQSTGDQWFDESQTESYRTLGSFTLDEMCRDWASGSLDDWCAHLERS